MAGHDKHQMQLTSLMQYFPTYSEEEFNQVFRQEVKRDIIRLLQKQPNMTDRELANALGYDDPNKVRPRRNELTKKEIVIEDTRRICVIGQQQSIAWKLSEEKLNAYMIG